MSKADEKGVSSWLTADPPNEKGMVLNKSDFRDAICLRYGFRLDGMPTTCVCGTAMTVDHGMTCPSAGYPTAQQNEVRDVMADAMCSVFSEVEIEPKLLSSTEDLSGKTMKCANEARVDI